MLYPRILAALLALCSLLFVCSGCGGNRTPATPVAANLAEEASIREAIVVADPQGAVNAIYDSLPEYEADPLSNWRLNKNLNISETDVVEFYGRISSENGGLADVIMILPEDGKRESVSLALSKYKESRIAEFENYDILDAYSIAQNAVIYEQGDYVILLMLADNDAARAIIDEYIPL